MWKQFDELVNLPTCTCNGAKEFYEHNPFLKLMQFLMGLDDVYLPVRSDILIRDPLPNVKTAFSIISREESHREIYSCSTEKRTDASFFAAQTFENNERVERNPKLLCDYCGLTGHTIKVCYDLVGYPNTIKRKKGYQRLHNQNISSNSCVFEKPNVFSCFDKFGCHGVVQKQQVVNCVVNESNFFSNNCTIKNQRESSNVSPFNTDILAQLSKSNMCQRNLMLIWRSLI